MEKHYPSRQPCGGEEEQLTDTSRPPRRNLRLRDAYLGDVSIQTMPERSSMQVAVPKPR